MAKRKVFDTLNDAFDYCREADKPVQVIVKGDTWKLWKVFPSGYAELQGIVDKDKIHVES